MKIFMTIVILTILARTHAGVGIYTNFTEWSDAADNNFTTIDFTGYPDGTFITSQYATLGVIFLDGNDNIFLTASMVNDGAGIDGNSTTTLEFVQPISALALHYPGNVQIDLMLNDELVYSSPDSPGGGVGFFYGLAATFSFNRVVIDNPFSPITASMVNDGAGIDGNSTTTLEFVQPITFSDSTALSSTIHSLRTLPSTTFTSARRFLRRGR